MNEAAADTGSTTKSRHARKTESDDDQAAADSSTAVASAPDAVEHHETSAAPTADVKPAGASSSATAVSYVPTPKTIDIP